MLGELLKAHNADVWLVNTGWSGGPYGVGKRMKLAYTRAMVHEALSGHLHELPTQTDPIFGLHVPTDVKGVPPEILTPRWTWDDPDAYDAQAKKLALMFRKNFEKFGSVDAAIAKAGPNG
jgi:phosphoenolpyruvate carboxykinase (ATP)